VHAAADSRTHACAQAVRRAESAADQTTSASLGLAVSGGQPLLVRWTGIEPATPRLATWCSTLELPIADVARFRTHAQDAFHQPHLKSAGQMRCWPGNIDRKKGVGNRESASRQSGVGSRVIASLPVRLTALSPRTPSLRFRSLPSRLPTADCRLPSSRDAGGSRTHLGPLCRRPPFRLAPASMGRESGIGSRA
jgi:hypothetical protein